MVAAGARDRTVIILLYFGVLIVGFYFLLVRPQRKQMAARRALGLAFAPEERLGRGAVPEHPLSLNMLLTRELGVGPAGWLRLSTLREAAQTIMDRFHVKAAGPQALAKSLSGGNLQKFMMGREMDANPRVLLVSQPTWGVDVGAAAQIRASLLALRAVGCAVLIVSDELDELMELSDRIQHCLTIFLANRNLVVDR
mgnify:CR=1 FL=1